jgi:hypothetical protein
MLQTMRELSTAVLCAAAISCAGRANGPPGDADWSMEGVIAAVDPGPAATRLTVDVSSGAAAEPGRVVLIVSPETEVEVQRADGTSARGGAADLVVGARIRARHTGVEMRSLPPQYQATHIRVLSGP